MRDDGSKINGSRVHFPLHTGESLADLRNRVNSQWYSSIYEDRRPKIVEDIEKSDNKKFVVGNLNNPLLKMDRSSKQNMNKDIVA